MASTPPHTAPPLSIPGLEGFYRGKVRDVYYLQGQRVLMVASDRISAFDHVLPRAIPHKGAVLNGVATHFLQATRDIVPNWLVDVPHPRAAVGMRCEPIKIEMVIRGYLAGHAWREYSAGRRELCGVRLPEGLREGDRLPSPIITPATKADEGHDEDISREEILGRELVAADVYAELESHTRALFARGTEMARARGLLLVDTKYEFGLHENRVVLIDEVHTPDSSRYYEVEGYDERQVAGEPQRQLSKEFVREWLMANGFRGRPGERMPEMPDEFVSEVSRRYIALYERLTGSPFAPVAAAEERDLGEALWGFLTTPD